jgi:hypothetical protein
LRPGKNHLGRAGAPQRLGLARGVGQAVGARGGNAGAALQLGRQDRIRSRRRRPGAFVEADHPEPVDGAGQRLVEAADFDARRVAPLRAEGPIAALAAQLAQGFAAIDAAEDGVQCRQPAEQLAQLIDRAGLRRQQGALAGPAQRLQQIAEYPAPGRRRLAAGGGAGAVEQRVEAGQQARRRHARGEAAHRGAVALQRGFGRQQPAQAGFDAGAGIGLIHIRRPAGRAEQGAKARLGDAARAGENLQQGQRHIDQGLRRQRFAADEFVIGFLCRPVGADGVALQGIAQGGLERAAARRQFGDGDAQAQRPAAGPRQALPDPGRGGTAFGLGIGAFDAARHGFHAAAEIDAEQLDAARFQHQQQARDQRIGHHKPGQADARRQAAHASHAAFDAGDAPGQDFVHAAPAAGPRGRLDVIAPAPPGQVFGVVQGFGHLDAPGALQAGRFHRRQRHALAVEELGRRAGVARDGELPQIAFLHMPKEAAGDGIGRDLAAQQGARHQRVEPQGRGRTLQRAPGDGAARHLRVAMRAAQVQRQPRRGAEHHRLGAAGQVGKRQDGKVGTDHPASGSISAPRAQRVVVMTNTATSAGWGFAAWLSVGMGLPP